jgi:hypothetical protein
MSPSIDVWVRGTAHATTLALPDLPADPNAWTEEDATRLLQGMLLAIEREKNPGGEAPAVTLRGFSWIVNPFEDGGVVLAIEMQMGAAVAGPFAIDEPRLSMLIQRVLQASAPGSPATH